jgi:hypothetical protein
MTCVIPDVVTRPVRGVMRGQIASAFGWKGRSPDGIIADICTLIGGADIRNPCGHGLP